MTNESPNPVETSDNESKLRGLYRKWCRVQEGVEPGKVHAANQQRFDRMAALEKEMANLGFAEDRHRILRDEHLRIYPHEKEKVTR